MKNFKLQIISLTIAVAGYFLLVGIGSAQNSPGLILTWESLNYAPPDYRGKIIPTRGTVVDAALELIDNGKIADISKREIRWILNNKLLESGVGLQNISFRIPDLARDNQTIRVTVINYRGANVEKVTSIPIADPEIVIAAPYLDNRINAGLNVFRALHYFFNIIDLSELEIIWSANGITAQSGSDEKDILELDTTRGQSGDEINISITATNKGNALESSNDAINLEIR